MIDTARFGLGCAPLGGLHRDVSEEEAFAVVQTALQRGIRLFDTAPSYGNGRSESHLGSALADAPDDAVVSTKVGHVVTDDGEATWDATPGGLRRSLELSLGRLRRDRVDILLLHDPQSAPGDWRTMIPGALEAMAALREEGLAARIGIGTADLEAHGLALSTGLIDVAMVSGRAYLLNRDAVPELLPRCRDAGVGVLNVAVLGTGLLAHPWPPDDAKWQYSQAPDELIQLARKMARRCEARGVDLPTAALNYADGLPAVEYVVAGASRPRNLIETHQRFATPMPPGLGEELVAIVEEGRP